MTGHRPFNELKKKITPIQLQNIATKVEHLKGEMSLMELRQARKQTQISLSETLHVGQAAVAKMEKRVDMYVSSLRDFVQAMGGELEVVAKFPEGNVTISNFASLGVTKPL
jgi:N-methylhydantoinase B/oxoprolinase/acetone carboxylase alpha subunit